MANSDKVKDALSGVEPIASEAPLTMDQMMRMLLATQSQLAESQRELAAAILESRKPYIDPKVLAAREADLLEKRKLVALEQKRRIVTKQVCPHKRENDTLNIKWQQHSNGITLGVCGTCFSQFDSRNPADLNLLRQDLKSIKNMGRAGEHARRGVLIDG